MSCSRCQGLMIRDHFMDFDGTIGHMWIHGYRCMNCGNMHDPVIEQHRRANKHQAPAMQHGEYEAEENEFILESETVIPRAA